MSKKNPGPPLDNMIKNLSVCHINAQSMYNKLDLITVELSKFDIITVSETWLDQSISDIDLALPSYQLPIRLDRNRHGGGVAVYVKKMHTIYRKIRLDHTQSGSHMVRGQFM